MSCYLPDGTVGLGYDYFRSLPEGDWDGNTGLYGSVNFAVPMPCSNFGVQFGGSYGLYDWTKRDSAVGDKKDNLQQQLFFTGGLFAKSSCEGIYSAGLVCDWMWNRRFGIFGVEASFGQLRGLVGYRCWRQDEFGLWGTLDLGNSCGRSEGITLKFRAISQISVFWKRDYFNGAETMAWVGVPYKRSLAFENGIAGKAIFGVQFRAPLCGRFFVEGYGSYMVPHSTSHRVRQQNYAANLCIEIKYDFGVQSCRTEPLMPLGNNSNFIVDTNYNPGY